MYSTEYILNDVGCGDLRIFSVEDILNTLVAADFEKELILDTAAIDENIGALLSGVIIECKERVLITRFDFSQNLNDTKK